jgi:hypothetical protein
MAVDVVTLYSLSEAVKILSTGFCITDCVWMCGRSFMVTGILSGYLLLMLQLCQLLDTRR